MVCGASSGKAPLDRHQMREEYVALRPKLGVPAYYPYQIGRDDLQIIGQHLLPQEEILLLRTEMVDFLAVAGVPEPIVIWRKDGVGSYRACQKSFACRRTTFRSMSLFQRWRFTRLFPGWSFTICGGRRAQASMLWQRVPAAETPEGGEPRKPYAFRTTVETGHSIIVERWGAYSTVETDKIWPHRAAGYPQTASFPLLQTRLTNLMEEPAAAVGIVPIDHPDVVAEDRGYAREQVLYLTRRTDSWGRPLWFPSSLAGSWSGPTFRQPRQGLPPPPARAKHPERSRATSPVPLPWQLSMHQATTSLGSLYWCQQRLLEEVPMALLALPYGVAAILPRLPLAALRLGLMTGTIRVFQWLFLHDEAMCRAAISRVQLTKTGETTCAAWRLTSGLGEREKIWRARVLGALLAAAGDDAEYYRQCFRHRYDQPTTITAAQRGAYWNSSLAEGVHTWPLDQSTVVRSLADAALGHLRGWPVASAFNVTEVEARAGAELLRETWEEYCKGKLSRAEVKAITGCTDIPQTQRPRGPLFPGEEAMDKAVDMVRHKAGKRGGLTRVVFKQRTNQLGIIAR